MLVSESSSNFHLEFEEVFSNLFGNVIQKSTPRSRYFSIQR